MTVAFGPRRATWIEIDGTAPALPPAEAEALAAFDEVYRSLCAMLYNYVPMSGHPGGSISSGRLARRVPIIESRDTSFARRCSSHPSVPAGRCGTTR